MENNNAEEPKVIIIYKSYTPAQKRAQQKYYETHKQKIIDKNVNYYRAKKDTDEYKQHKAIYNINYREKKKLLQQATETDDQVIRKEPTPEQ